MFMKFMEMMKRKNNRKGFTLVELMVVVVIIGILVAIAVPVYNGASANAQINADKATARTILGAVSMASANGNTSSPTAGAINAGLSSPKIIVAAAATATNTWAVNYDASAGAWKVYHWNGTASVEITVP